MNNTGGITIQIGLLRSSSFINRRKEKKWGNENDDNNDNILFAIGTSDEGHITEKKEM